MLEKLVEKSATRRRAPFKLAGSMTSDLTEEELETAMARVEAEVSAAERRRFERLARELR